ncbi:MAG TPA: TetR-like C-terminal domain-containing protein [Smithella sp.]|nr:TetR-like C-terminal domain-containing protein [Smithella sp.]HOG82057.1 TetR-like C-terminal domain-containing protein [Smithellaceae bacterium]
MIKKDVHAKAEYRSAIRSRKLIKQAYVELIKEKDIDKITIKDVVTKADINRGTFYAHYNSINAVSEQIGSEIVSALFEFLDEFKDSRMIENPLPFLRKISRFLEEDLEFYRILINSQSSIIFLNKLKRLFVNKIRSDEKKMSAIKNKDQFIICVDLFASGFVGLYQDWFNYKIKMSLDELAVNFSEIIKNGFKPYLPAKK